METFIESYCLWDIVLSMLHSLTNLFCPQTISGTLIIIPILQMRKLRPRDLLKTTKVVRPEFGRIHVWFQDYIYHFD